MNDAADERLRRAVAAPEESAPAGDGCPPDGEIWSASRGELPPEAVQRLLDHMVDCPACDESWRMALALGREAAGAGRSWRRLAGLAAAAAVLAMAAWLVWVQPIPVHAPAEPFRGGDGDILQPVPAAGEALPRDGFLLRWTGAPEGSIYSVEVVGADLEVLYRAQDLERPEVLVPASRLERLAPGDPVFWRVEAVLPDGARIDSPIFRVPIR